MSIFNDKIINKKEMGDTKSEEKISSENKEKLKKYEEEVNKVVDVPSLLKYIFLKRD